MKQTSQNKTYPRLYNIERNPDWNVFLNIFCNDKRHGKIKFFQSKFNKNENLSTLMKKLHDLEIIVYCGYQSPSIQKQ